MAPTVAAALLLASTMNIGYTHIPKGRNPEKYGYIFRGAADLGSVWEQSVKKRDITVCQRRTRMMADGETTQSNRFKVHPLPSIMVHKNIMAIVGYFYSCSC